MKEHSRVDSKVDYRPLVLLVLGLAICVAHLIDTIEFPWNKKESLSGQDIYVWISGDAVEEGIYRFPDGIMLDEVYAELELPVLTANGFSNFPVEHLSTIQINKQKSPVVAGLHPRMASFFFQPIPINKTDFATLTTIRGIGPTLASRIIEYREEKGAFRSPEDLLEVRGIGKVKLARLEKEISFE